MILWTANFNRVFEVIEDLLSSFKRCLLMGDFNYDLQDLDGDAKDFLQRLTSFRFDVPRFRFTYWDHHGNSELDIFALYGLKWVRYKRGPFSLVVGHLPLLVTFEPSVPPLSQQTFCRDKSAYSQDTFSAALENYDWSFWNSVAISEMAESWLPRCWTH